MPSSRTELHLHEQVLLLALRDRKGTPEFRAGFHHLALGGAILAELALDGCIRVEEGRKAFVDAVPGAGRPRNEVLAEALEKVRGRKRRRRAAAWVQVFSSMKQLRHRTARGLCRRGILRQTDSSVLLVFSRRAYPTLDPGPERSLVERLRAGIAGDGDVDPALGVILGVAHATGMLRIHFERRFLAGRKNRLKRIVAGKHLSADGFAGHSVLATHQATQAAAAAVQAATIAAVAASTAAASAAASS